jgi:DNA-binding NtrC family response regulator
VEPEPLAREPCMSAKVLIYGAYSVLLRTRIMLLEGAGIEVRSTEQFEEAKKIVSDEHLDAVVLCHSLHVDKEAELLNVVHEVQPATKALIMADDDSLLSMAFGDRRLESFSGPDAFLSTVRKMIN